MTWQRPRGAEAGPKLVAVPLGTRLHRNTPANFFHKGQGEQPPGKGGR